MNMDLHALQDNRRSEYQFGEITEEIIGGAFEVIHELGTDEIMSEKAIAPEHQAQIIN